MNRRDFLKAIAAAGLAASTPELARRFWQVGRGAPVARVNYAHGVRRVLLISTEMTEPKFARRCPPDFEQMVTEALPSLISPGSIEAAYRNFVPGTALVDYEHCSLNGEPATAGTVAGLVLERSGARVDLYADVDWSEEAERLVRGGAYSHASVCVLDAGSLDSKVISVGLTRAPLFPDLQRIGA